VKPKHIIEFPKWTRKTQLFESTNSYQEVKDKVTQLTDTLLTKIGRPEFNTRDLFDWFNPMVDLYSNGAYENYIFTTMKTILSTYFDITNPFFSKSNTDLTRDDIQRIIKFKEIRRKEIEFSKKAEDDLKLLGLL
jgi:hypothetical protein